MPGPTGRTYDFDSYVTATPPPAPPVAVKIINGGDAKTGPPKPGAAKGAGVNLDSFHE